MDTHKQSTDKHQYSGTETMVEGRDYFDFPVINTRTPFHTDYHIDRKTAKAILEIFLPHQGLPSLGWVMTLLDNSMTQILRKHPSNLGGGAFILNLGDDATTCRYIRTYSKPGEKQPHILVFPKGDADDADISFWKNLTK